MLHLLPPKLHHSSPVMKSLQSPHMTKNSCNPPSCDRVLAIPPHAKHSLQFPRQSLQFPRAMDRKPHSSPTFPPLLPLNSPCACLFLPIPPSLVPLAFHHTSPDSTTAFPPSRTPVGVRKYTFVPYRDQKCSSTVPLGRPFSRRL